MYRHRKIVYEQISCDKHPEFEVRNTRVSEYLRKYGQGKIDSLPTDSRPVVTDPRSVDEMIDTNDKMDHMSREQLDVLLELQSKHEDFEKALADIKLTEKQKKEFDAAVKSINDPNASYEQKMDAYRIIDQLEKANKVKRARD